MGFSTAFFLFVFLPCCLIMTGSLYSLGLFNNWLGRFIKKIRLWDCSIICFSVFFYGWSCFGNIYKFVILIIAVYFIGFLICKLSDRNSNKQELNNSGVEKKYFSISRIVCFMAVLAILFLLFQSKYWEYICTLLQIEHSESLWEPLGISFLSFSIITYFVDIFRGTEAGSFIDCALYISFFPKVVSGPIVPWREFKEKIYNRRISSTGLLYGFNRMAVGFGKKIILADTFGECVQRITDSFSSGIDAPTAWLSFFLYMMQIYYDFSGYSDIAIGLSAIFGFEFEDNFRFPYLSSSITEFWRRWHISLGAWFREYVYIPLGGSRRGIVRTLLNLGIVFLLTGIWHGAGMNYLLWGAVNGALVIIERLMWRKNFYEKIPLVCKWISCMFIVLIFWQLFRFETLTEIGTWLSVAFGVTTFDNVFLGFRYFMSPKMVTLLLIATIGATLFGCTKVVKIYNKVSEKAIFMLVKEVIILALFILAIMFMINSTYSPFIYAQY